MKLVVLKYSKFMEKLPLFANGKVPSSKASPTECAECIFNLFYILITSNYFGS